VRTDFAVGKRHGFEIALFLWCGFSVRSGLMKEDEGEVGVEKMLLRFGDTKTLWLSCVSI
jgi:hypothetical protein